MAEEKIKWYLRPGMILLEVLLLGPLAIPMVWMSPALKKWQKIVVICFLVVFTIWFVKLSVDAYRYLEKELADMKALLNP